MEEVDEDYEAHENAIICFDGSVTTIPAEFLLGNLNIVELICEPGVKRIEEAAFAYCRRLQRVVLFGAKDVEAHGLVACEALENVECELLERVGEYAFRSCVSLGSINLPSIQRVARGAFIDCLALTHVTFGDDLEAIQTMAFFRCSSLEWITIPLKDGLFTDNTIFTACDCLKRVDILEGPIHDTANALLLDEWKIDMSNEIDSINQILPGANAGNYNNDREHGEKTYEIRMWIKRVIRKITHYQVEQNRLLTEAATALQSRLPLEISC